MSGRCTLKNKSVSKGFTLLETLAAFVVFVVMIAGAYSLLLEAMKLHQRQKKLIGDAYFIMKYNKSANISHVDGFKYQLIKYHRLKLLRFLQ